MPFAYVLAVVFDRCNFTLSVALCRAALADERWNREMQARLAMGLQFLLLLRDLLFLLPFAVIVATVARLPGVLLDLAARLAGKASKDLPLLEVSSIISCALGRALLISAFHPTHPVQSSILPLLHYSIDPTLTYQINPVIQPRSPKP